MHDPFEQMRRMSLEITRAQHQPLFQHQEEILKAFEWKNQLMESALPHIIEEQNKIREMMESALDQIPKFHDLIPKNQWEHALDSTNQIKESLSAITFPQLQQHMKFITSVIESIDFESLRQYIPENNEGQEEPEKQDDEVHITQPQYFHTATKLVVVVNIVDDRMEQANVDREISEKWKKVVKPVIELLIAFLLGWAVSNVPLQEMNIVKTFHNVVETISSYDLDIIEDHEDLKDNSLNKTQRNKGL